MKFELTFHDRNGTELNFGDIVAVSDGKHINFYAEVKWIEQQQVLAPFHTFSFHSFLKVNEVPDGAIKSSETRYNIWYLPESIEDTERFESYLMSWRECEIMIQKAAFRIKPMQQPAQQTLF